MSRYDYSDPSTDPDYCNGLRAADDAPLYTIVPTCFFCGEPLHDATSDYCSSLCACYAERDSNERY